MTSFNLPFDIRIFPDGSIAALDCDRRSQAPIELSDLRALADIVEGMRSASTETISNAVTDSGANLESMVGQGAAERAGGGSSPPVFLLGSHRSGTTLLRYILDTHSEIACPPESKFIGGLYSMVNYPQVGSAMRHLGLTRDDLYSHIRMFVNSVMWQYTLAHGKVRWVDKTPNYIRLAEFIEQVFQGEALYILMVRHPLDCIDSLERFSNRLPVIDRPDPDLTSFSQRFGSGKYGCSRYWKEANEHLSVFHSGHSERCVLVKYEDLISRTEEQVRKILSFIGSTYEEAIVDRVFEVSHELGFQDPSIARSTAVETSRIEYWKSWPPREAERIWAVVENIGVQFGYKID